MNPRKVPDRPAEFWKKCVDFRCETLDNESWIRRQEQPENLLQERIRALAERFARFGIL